MTGRWFALLSAFICLISSSIAYAQSDASSAEAEAAIRAQAARFSAAYVADDVDTLVQIYADDGVAAPGGRDFVRGRDELRQLWTATNSGRVLRHKLTPIEIVIDGRHAYDYGYYEGATGTEQAPTEFSGKYLVVWQLDADGQWRMAQDMWNSLPAE